MAASLASPACVCWTAFSAGAAAAPMIAVAMRRRDESCMLFWEMRVYLTDCREDSGCWSIGGIES